MSLERARTRTLLALVAMLLVIAGCASGHGSSTSTDKNSPSSSPGAVAGGGPRTSSAPAGATVTKIRVFAPFDRGGAPTAGVEAHRSGSCFTTSITVMARHAFRCFAGNAILDPCFATSANTHVLDCYAAPWSRPIQLRVHALPAAPVTVRITRPWAIELADGVRCVVTNGTPTMVRGVALGYECADGFAGLRTTSGHTLTALYRATDGLVRVSPVTIAWRAGTN